MPSNAFAGAQLSINLDAIAANWRALTARLKAGARAGAVVKADAYGLGLAAVAPALHNAGCREFFTASLWVFIDGYFDVQGNMIFNF